MQLLTDRYHEQIAGVISCYDRIVLTGSLIGFNYPQAMAAFLNKQSIRIFDYPQFASSLRDIIRESEKYL